MKIAIYPGSFDPITLGHLNLIKRIAATFERVVVCIMVNPDKKPLFTQEERLRQVRTVVSKFQNVEVDCYEGLVAEYAREKGSSVVVRGLRALSDFERECQMAITSKKINPELETFFLAADEKYMYLSSSGVKELARFGANLEAFAPREILGEIAEKINALKGVK